MTFWRRAIERHASAHHLQEMLASRRRSQLKRVGMTGIGMLPWIRCAHYCPHCIARIRAARRLLCRAALLRWMICLLTSESMTGTAWL